MVTGTEKVKELCDQDLCRLSILMLGSTRMVVVLGLEKKTIKQMLKFSVKVRP